MEEEAEKYFEKILKMGNGSFYQGVLEGIRNGFFRKEIARASFEFQSKVERRERIIIGVNVFEEEEEEEGGRFEFPKFRLNPSCQDEQIKFLKYVKSSRDNKAVLQKLNDLKSAAKQGKNLVPFIKDAVKEYATEGEIIDTLKEVYGEFLDLKML
jgi:methylmalonyl-CoA mutase N-terminal domain/subunit